MGYITALFLILTFFIGPYGSCFIHLKEYWEMRHLSNFLFIKYEDMNKVLF